MALIDLRERAERERHGTIPGSLHVPYPSLQENISAGGMLHELAQIDRQAACCSTAPSASARRWRCRRRRMPGCPPPVTSRAASRPGRRPAARSSNDLLGQSDMTNFAPVSGLLGGALIGLAAIILMLSDKASWLRRLCIRGPDRRLLIGPPHLAARLPLAIITLTKQTP